MLKEKTHQYFSWKFSGYLYNKIGSLRIPRTYYAAPNASTEQAPPPGQGDFFDPILNGLPGLATNIFAAPNSALVHVITHSECELSYSRSKLYQVDAKTQARVHPFYGPYAA